MNHYANLFYCQNQSKWCCSVDSYGTDCCSNEDLLIDGGVNSVDWGYIFLPEDTTDSDSSNSDSNSNLGTIVGAAVGVPLGVLTLGVLSWLFWKERRKSKSRERDHALHMSTMQPLVGKDSGNPDHAQQDEGDRSRQQEPERHELYEQRDIPELAH